MKRAFILLFLIVASVAHAQSSFTFDNKRGPHPVGFRAVFQFDESRRYERTMPPVPVVPAAGSISPISASQSGARPIQTLIWYPAKESSKPMTYGEYIEFGVNRENFNLSPRETAQLADELLKAYRWTPEQIALEKVRPQWASRDAPAATGPFPVVLYAPSLGGPAYENADLCEYLASHGYVVIASPSQGMDGKGMTANLAGMNAQVEDIRFLMRYAANVAEANASSIAIIGFSWGGISNFFASVEMPDVQALVFLDGAIRYFPQLLEQGNLSSGGRFNVPMLYFSQRTTPFRDQQTKIDIGDKILAKLTSKNLHLITMNYLSHQDQSSLFIREFGRKRYAAATPEEVSASYGAMALYVHRFLDATLKNDRASQSFMKRSPVANKIPLNVMTMKTLRGAR